LTALALAGCGGAARPHGSPVATTAATALPSCADAGITDRTLNEGRCLRRAQQLTVVNREHLLVLPGLNVGLGRQGVQASLPARTAVSERGYVFLVLKLDVTNKLAREVRFGTPVNAGRQPQVRVLLGGHEYVESAAAERLLAGAFVNQPPIPPSGHRSGLVVVPIPESQGSAVNASGNTLGVLDFGDVGTSTVPRAIGLIRLFA